VDLDDVFGGGALGRVLKRHEVRPPQEAMARAVWDALEGERNLVVEAGTGVGKSLAYLLPAALWALRHDKRVLVSTHTRALQEQLMGSDLPAAAKVLGEGGLPLRTAMLMGAENYLCMQRLSRLAAQPSLTSEGGERTVAALAEWAKGASSGHRSALPELVPETLWRKLHRDSDVCLGPGGPYWDRCLWRKDREKAERAHIVVVNHALLLSGARLPPYDAVILDEAHNLEEAATQRYGSHVSLGRMSLLSEEAAATGKVLGREALADAAHQALAGVARFLEGMARDRGLNGPDDEASGKLLEKTPEAPPTALIGLDKALAELALDFEGRPEENDLRLLHARVTGLGMDLMQILKPSGGETARWVSWPRTGPELRSAPLDVGQRLAEGLFSKGVPSILTSATLSTGDGGLKEFKARVGLPDATELVLDSPYDYRSQAALWLADGIPSPKEEDAHAEAVAARCADIVAAVPGGVFILFSSWRLLRRVHAILRKSLKGKRPVWAQGSAGHEALLEQFEAAGDAVLLGVDTFWQGVDVPGAALSCVVLVKLPFPNISSPVEEARKRWLEENGREYFRDWSLPKAVMKFRQGFGRLIRSSTDRGAVVVLDSRLLHKGYGKFFVESLPSCKRLEGLDELKAFFASPS
jgi:ATP-dependent DNA helicase DinG